jgi:dTDP-4-amino-4,6-dideoxygalactose transaminase
MRLCYKKPFSSQRVWKYLQQSVESGHITNDGPLQSILAAKMQAFVRSVNTVLLAGNGTSALHALCVGLALKAKKDLKWVTQAFTFPSSIQGPLKDSFVADLDPEWYGPSRDFLESQKDTFDGIIVTNVFGHQTNLAMYEKWCKNNGKLLVLDNAASPIGFLRDSRCIHDVGDGAIVSLHETKPIGRGEGGVIFAKREVLPFVHQAMNFGFDIPKQVREPHRSCSNWRMSDIAAAAICDHLDFMLNNKWEDKLQELTKFAVSELERKSMSLALPVQYPTILSCLFIKLSGPTETERMLNLLHSHNIEAKHYYEPLCTKEEAPEAWKLFESTICIPFHLGFSQNQLKKVIELIASNR